MGTLAANPIRLVYLAMKNMVEAQSQFTTEVLAGNRIYYTGTDPHPEKKARIQPGDFPEVRLVPVSIKPHLRRTSDGGSMLVRWSWQVNSGSQLFAPLFDVEWALYLAMNDWHTYLRDDTDTRPTWNGKPIVELCRPLEVEIRMDDSGANKGWRDSWMGETELWFTTTDLTAA